ncbi:MAG: uroporphyrinogen-III C-methyltransferase [Rubrivivax sp.]|nr:uroporphyrinogen-III C-methyltransferase [Rubrivivax sp.]
MVGAGPGDPELLTLKALRIARLATLLLVDDLVSDAVLARVLRGRRQPPRVVHVGKRGGCRSTPQAFIERLMVNAALAGERVVRLKGGDPFVFGRGGEEAQALRERGIAVEVINGITAGLAAATALHVPWTHRDHAQGVMLVTAHARDGAPGPDWALLGAAAAQGLTLVIYMGMARLDAVAHGLMRTLRSPDAATAPNADAPAALSRAAPAALSRDAPAALGADTPAALVQHAAMPQQRELLTTLGRLAVDARVHGFGSPAIVLIGNVLLARAALPLPTVAERPRRSASAPGG